MDKEALKNKVLNGPYLDQLVDTTFNNADLNKNSLIEKKEFEILLKSIYGTLGLDPPNKQEIEDEFKRLDTNKDDKLDKEEFKVLVKELTLFSIEEM